MLSELADVTYKISAYYDAELEGGFAFDDPDGGDRVADGASCSPPSATARAPTLAELEPTLPFSTYQAHA